MNENGRRGNDRLGRRSVLKGLGVVGGTTAMGLVPSFANGQVGESPGRRDYVDACGTLIGITGDVLEPVNRPGKLADGFLRLTEAAVIEGKAAMARWLSTYSRGVERGDTSDEIAQLLHEDSPTLCRLGMKLWLFGMWTGANETDSLVDLTFEGHSVKETFVYSAVAYRRGWIWRIAQAHPMGYSHFNPNSWGEAAPSLTDYIGHDSR